MIWISWTWFLGYFRVNYFRITIYICKNVYTVYISINLIKHSLREKCPNMELFLVRIWTLFTQWVLLNALRIWWEQISNRLKNNFVYQRHVSSSRWTHLRQFAIDSTSKFHVESTWRFYRFWKANPRGNYDIDWTWKFQPGFDFQNRRNFDEFSTWIFLCRFDVEST